MFAFSGSWVGILVVRKIVRSLVVRSESFRKAILLLRVPKEDLKEEQNQNDSQRKQTTEARIAIIEAFYGALANIPRQTGWQSFWLGRNDHISLEIIADKDQLISFYAAVPLHLVRYFEQQFQAQYDSAVVTQEDDYNIFDDGGVSLGSYAKSANNPIFSLKTYEQFDHDPLNIVLNSFSKINRDGEGAAIQLIFKPVGDTYTSKYKYALERINKGTKVKEAIDIPETVFGHIVKFGKEVARDLTNKKEKEEKEKEKELKNIDEIVVEDIDDFLVGEADSRPGVLFFWFCRWAACELQLKYFLDMLSRYRRDFKTPQPGGLIFTQPRDIFAKQRWRIVAQQECGGSQSRDNHTSFFHDSSYECCNR